MKKTMSAVLFGTLVSFFSLTAYAETVNINTADAEALARVLSGIGPAKAKAIVDYRKDNKPFKTVDEITNVSGIGPKLLEKNRDKMRVSEAAPKKEKPPKKESKESKPKEESSKSE